LKATLLPLIEIRTRRERHAAQCLSKFRPALGEPAAGASGAASSAVPINPDPTIPRTILVPTTLVFIQMLLDALTPRN